MDSQQELFTALKVQLEKTLKSKKIKVYDSCLPDEGTPYPFVYIGSSQLVDDYGNKTMVFGNISQVVAFDKLEHRVQVGRNQSQRLKLELGRHGYNGTNQNSSINAL